MYMTKWHCQMTCGTTQWCSQTPPPNGMTKWHCQTTWPFQMAWPNGTTKWHTSPPNDAAKQHCKTTWPMALPNNKLHHPMMQPNKLPNSMAKWHCQMAKWPNGTAKCKVAMHQQHGWTTWPHGSAQRHGLITLPNPMTLPKPHWHQS